MASDVVARGVGALGAMRRFWSDPRYNPRRVASRDRVVDRDQAATNVASREAWLDVLRGGSILLVLGSHYQINWRDAGLFRPLAQFNMRFGWSGVDMFFVISGFLIGRLLIGELDRSGGIDFGRFYWRRTLKIWPLLYLTSAAWMLLSVYRGEAVADVVSASWPAFAHIQNYLVTPLGHLWSLAVEEHFYILLPVVLYALGRQGRSARKVIPCTMLGVMLAVLLFRSAVAFGVFDQVDSLPKTIRIQTQYRIDSLLAGVLLAWVHLQRPVAWSWMTANRRLAITVALASLWPFVFNPNTSAIIAGPGLTSIYIAYGCILVAASTLRRPADRRLTDVASGALMDAVAFVGRQSFAIYLFHPFIWMAFERYGFGPTKPMPFLILGSNSLTWMTGYIVFIVSSVCLGAAVTAWIEQPILRWRNRTTARWLSARARSHGLTSGGAA